MEQIHVQLRYVPDQKHFQWEIKFQEQGEHKSTVFEQPPEACQAFVAYMGHALRTKPTDSKDELASIVYRPNEGFFCWKVGDLSMYLDSGSLARVLEYLETVLESTQRYLQQQ
jgi:hypothetical protein